MKQLGNLSKNSLSIQILFNKHRDKKKNATSDKSSALTETKINKKKTGRLGDSETRGKASKFHPVTKSPSPPVLPNRDWKLHKEELNSLGLQLNSTVLKLIKEYPSQEVERSIGRSLPATLIAFLKIRKRDNYIENPTGYFVQALKENWSSFALLETWRQGDGEKHLLTKSQAPQVFYYWYSLAKELGHVTGSEIKDGEQWVCFTGSWEQYQDVVEREYTVDYLKKVLDRYRNR